MAKERQEIWDSGTFIGPRTHVTGYLADGNRVYYSVAEGIGSDVHLDRALDRAGAAAAGLHQNLCAPAGPSAGTGAGNLHMKTASRCRPTSFFLPLPYGMDQVEHIGGTQPPGLPAESERPRQQLRRCGSNCCRNPAWAITPTAVLPGYAVIAAEETDLFRHAAVRLLLRRHTAAQAASHARQDVWPWRSSHLHGRKQWQVPRKTLPDADALVVSGTDSPFVPYGAGLHAELRLYARAGLTPAQILKAASVNAAKSSGRRPRHRYAAKPGMIADLVVVDGDPLANIAECGQRGDDHQEWSRLPPAATDDRARRSRALI